MLTLTNYELSIKKFKKVASIFAIASISISSAWAQCAAPTVSGTTICAGQIANLTPSPIVANTSYDWYTVAAGGTPIQTANSFTPQLSATTTFYVAARTSTCTSTRTAVTVKVNPLPADGFFTLSQSSICTGGSVVITVVNTGIQVSIVSPPTASYIPTSGSNTPTGYTYADQLGGTGTYTATATTTLGCSKSISQTVVTTPRPTVTLPSKAICENTALSLTASTIAGATYTWTGPNSFTSSTTNPTVNVSNVATLSMQGTYTVKATVNGCTSSTVSSNVSVSPKLVAPVLYTTGGMCFTPGVSKFVNVTIGTYPGAAVWTKPSNFTQTFLSPNGGQEIQGKFTSAIPSPFSVYTTDPVCGNSPTTTFTVYPNPVPVITAAKFKMCKDETVQLVADAPGGTWSISSALPALTGGATINSTISSAGLFTGNNPGLYTIRYTVTVNGCSGYSEKVITVGALPFTINGPDKMCQNKNAVYTVYQPQQGSGNVYSWNVYQNPNIVINGPYISNFNLENATLNSGNTPEGTVLNLKATGTFECIAATATQPAVTKTSEASKLVTVVSGPNSSDILLKCADASCNTLTATMRDGSSISGFTFKWYTNTNPSIGNTVTVNNARTDEYTFCEVTNANGCSNTFLWRADFSLDECGKPKYNFNKAYYCNQNYPGVSCSRPNNARLDNTKDFILTVFPNPASKLITFETNGLEGVATIYTIEGEIVKTLPLIKDETTYPVNVSTFESGMYILRLTYSDGKVYTAPLIKE